MLKFVIVLIPVLFMIGYLCWRRSLHIIEIFAVFFYVGILYQAGIVFMASNLKLLQESRDIGLFWTLVWVRIVLTPLFITVIASEMRLMSSMWGKSALFLLGVLKLQSTSELIVRYDLLLVFPPFATEWFVVYWVVQLLSALLLLRLFRIRLEKELDPTCQ